MRGSFLVVSCQLSVVSKKLSLIFHNPTSLQEQVASPLTRFAMTPKQSRCLQIILLSVICFFFTACSNPHTPSTQAEPFYLPQYAKGFWIEQSGDDKVLHIKNPWQGAEGVQYSYRLVSREDKEALTTSLMNIPVPLKRVVCLSTTHLAYIDALQETETVIGISGAGYVSNALIRAALSKGKVKDVGYESGISYESLAVLQPDVVFAYGVAGEMSAVVDKINSMGIRVVFLGDYLEDSPLGKAEYMVAVSAFYGKEAEAEALFACVVEDYTAVKVLAAEPTYRPKVILNAPWRNAWYIPGGANYLSTLITDAGGEVLGAREGSRESAPISLEKAYTYALQANYWLHPNMAHSLAELKSNDPRFAAIPAFRQHRVFNNTLRRRPEGGSDFWESGVVQPHIILRDLIRILHPDLLPEHRLVYYEQLAP
ncbi:MAG: ABC transporter substrate-binding protein [Bacteroidales bacterium]|nr:ABC transporter substrate-binding protein [Bacteroidales bacterium]